MSLALFIIVYVVAEWFLDDIAHKMVYSVVGKGQPLTGWRRLLVCAFTPIIFVVGVLVCAPIGILAVIAVVSLGRK